MGNNKKILHININKTKFIIMKTIKLTKKDFNSDNEFIGNDEILTYDGNLEIEEGLGIVKFRFLKIRGYILSKAGCGIEAGDGIEAGLFIKCKLKLSIGLRIFAGLCIWKNPSKEEVKIECGELEKGEVCFGNLIETGIKEEKSNKYEIDGVEYSEETLRSIIKKATS